MTRRGAILIGLGLPAWAAGGKPFWDEKEPQNWTDEEREQLLTRSPWVRAGQVNYDTGPGGLTGRSPAVTSRRGRPISGDTASAPEPIGKYDAMVRWESALPVREANRFKFKGDPAAFYVLFVTGDLPMINRPAEESETDFGNRLDMLKQYTKLEKKGDPIYLSKIGYEGTAGSLFYFERNDLIRLDDRQVTFTTKLGPVQIKAKFTLKEMLYRGKLEL